MKVKQAICWETNKISVFTSKEQLYSEQCKYSSLCIKKELQAERSICLLLC